MKTTITRNKHIAAMLLIVACAGAATSAGAATENLRKAREKRAEAARSGFINMERSGMYKIKPETLQIIMPKGEPMSVRAVVSVHEKGGERGRRIDELGRLTLGGSVQENIRIETVVLAVEVNCDPMPKAPMYSMKVYAANELDANNKSIAALRATDQIGAFNRPYEPVNTHNFSDITEDLAPQTLARLMCKFVGKDPKPTPWAHPIKLEQMVDEYAPHEMIPAWQK